MLDANDGCPHDDVRPINEDWGRCAKRGEDDFPISDRATWGDVECSTCKDTGVVPVTLAGTIRTLKGEVVDVSGAFASGWCLDCNAGRKE